MSGHLELTVTVRPAAVEAAADILRAYAPAGISIEPPFESLDEDGNVAFTTDSPTQVRAWLAADARADIDAIRGDLAALGDDLVEPLAVRAVESESWADTWKEHFHPMRVGERLVLRPAWRTYAARPDDVVVEIDPGQAFGTGQHATTRMCLAELEQRLRPGARVLDVGSGSGILSTAAALLGAEHVDAIDIDPVAVSATADNARRNEVADGSNSIVRVARGSLGAAWPFDEPPAGRYDVTLGNLSSRVVRELSAALVSSLSPDGVGLLSGIIDEQEAACVASLESAGGRLIETLAEDDWRLIVVSRAE